MRLGIVKSENYVLDLPLLSAFTIFVKDRIRLGIKLKQVGFSALGFRYFYKKEKSNESFS